MTDATLVRRRRSRNPKRLVSVTLVGAACLRLGLFATAAHADVPEARRGARLAWARGVGADDCVGKIGLEEDVKARLGYDPFVLPGHVFVEGTIVRTAGAAGAFRADLVMRDASGGLLGTRQLTSREGSCRTLGETVAVAITVAIDPNAAGTRQKDVAEDPPDVEKVVEERAPIAPPAPVEPPRERGRAAVAIGGGIGLVPEITPVVSLRARGSIGARWELGVGAQLWVESQTSGMGFGLTTASADLCVIPLGGVRALRWCAGGHLGVLHVAVHAAELVPVTVGMVPWAGAETGPHLSLPLLGGPLRLEAGVSAIVPITRREAFVRGRPDVVWEQSVVAGRADLGVGASF